MVIIIIIINSTKEESKLYYTEYCYNKKIISIIFIHLIIIKCKYK